MQSTAHTTGAQNASQFTKKSRHVFKNTQLFNNLFTPQTVFMLKNSPKWSAGKEKKRLHIAECS